MSTIRNEFAGEAFGVDGRFHNVITWSESDSVERCRGKIANQTFNATRTASDGGQITVNVRFDDNCKNGHESLAITAEWKHKDGGESGGCLHDEIAETFPEFAPLIPYHLCSTDGPMHYPGNVLYLAGDRDCLGRKKGEPSRIKRMIQFGDSPVTHPVTNSFADWIEDRLDSGGEFRVVAIAHDNKPGDYNYQPHYTLAGYGEKWHDCPFRNEQSAQEFAEGLNKCAVRFIEHVDERSEGKERELDAARRAAIWPEATDDVLSADKIVLETLLMDRLPGLLEEFRSLVEGFGFLYGVPVET